MLNLSDIYLDLKEACRRLLENINLKIKQELFDAPLETLKIRQAAQIKMGESFIKELESDLKDLINFNNNNIHSSFNEDECMVKTDLKYLNFIKRIEMNMLLESKRRVKTKRLEIKEFSKEFPQINYHEFEKVSSIPHIILEEDKNYSTVNENEIEIENYSSSSNFSDLINKKIKNNKPCNKSNNQHEIKNELKNEKILKTKKNSKGEKIKMPKKNKITKNREEFEILIDISEDEKIMENINLPNKEKEGHFIQRKLLRSTRNSRNKLDENLNLNLNLNSNSNFLKSNKFVDKSKNCKKKKKEEDNLNLRLNLDLTLSDLEINENLNVITLDPELTESETESFGNSNNRSFSKLRRSEGKGIGIKVLHN